MNNIGMRSRSNALEAVATSMCQMVWVVRGDVFASLSSRVWVYVTTVRGVG